MFDPLDPETYGPPTSLAPGAVAHCTGAVRVAWRGPWELRDGGAAWSDGARLVFNGYPVFLDGPESDVEFHPGWDDEGEEKGDPIYVKIEPQLCEALRLLGLPAEHA